MDPRQRNLFILYAGATLAALEVAAELFLAPIPDWLTSLARILQIAGVLLVIVAVIHLRQPHPVPQLHEDLDELDVLAHAKRLTQRYIRDALLHSLGTGMILLVTGAFGLLSLIRAWPTTTESAYHAIVLTIAYLGLASAWAIPMRGLAREYDRIKRLERSH